jgi:hypothetical protein
MSAADKARLLLEFHHRCRSGCLKPIHFLLLAARSDRVILAACNILVGTRPVSRNDSLVVIVHSVETVPTYSSVKRRVRSHDDRNPTLR